MTDIGSGQRIRSRNRLVVTQIERGLTAAPDGPRARGSRPPNEMS